MIERWSGMVGGLHTRTCTPPPHGVSDGVGWGGVAILARNFGLFHKMILDWSLKPEVQGSNTSPGRFSLQLSSRVLAFEARGPGF